MIHRRSLINVAVMFLTLLTLNCECEEGGSLETSAPLIDFYFVGLDEVAPDLSRFVALSDADPIAVDFGLSDLNTINRRYLYVHNGGSKRLTLGQVEIDAATSTDFTVECLNGTFSVCPNAANFSIVAEVGESLVLRLTYVPQDLGPDSGSLKIYTDDVQHTPLAVSLKGEGVTPEIQVCVSDCVGDQTAADCVGAQPICNDDVAPEKLQVQFGDALMSDNIQRQVTIHNRGQRALQISNLSYKSGDSVQFGLDLGQSALPGVLKAGEQAEFVLNYDPSVGGDHAAIFQIISNDINEKEVQLALLGRGLAPRLCPDPLSVDFGNVSTGDQMEKMIQVTNCGLLDLEFSAATLTSSSSPDFSISSNPTPASVAPGDSVAVGVSYFPQVQGSDAGGVQLYSNDPSSDPGSGLTGTITLKGSSVPRACDITTTPAAVQFGAVLKNQPETVDLIVSNTGSDSCTLHEVNITTNSSENEFSILQAPSANTRFEPGDTFVVVLQYLPVDAGADIGVLSLFGDDKDTDEIKIDLNGTAIDSAECDLMIQPTSIRFGTVKLNRTANQRFVLTNVGLADCVISEVALKLMPRMGDFQITAAPRIPFVLSERGTPNAQAEIEITFAPKRTTSHVRALWITSNDPDLKLEGDSIWDVATCTPGPVEGQACLPVSGYSAESEIEVVPDELDFGVVTFGCNSPELQVTVYNLGSIAIDITNIYLQNNDGNFEIRQAPQTPYSLAGGNSMPIRLRYHPQDLGIHRDSLIIESDASNVSELSVPLMGSGTDIADQTDLFNQLSEVKSDVLFVVDNSGSMEEEQNALAENFSTFIAQATSLDVDYHIGVIATEVNDPETGGNPQRDIIPGVLVQAPGRPKVITNNTPNLIAAFTDNVRLGTCCSDEAEAGLQAAWMALSEPNIDDPTKNKGFLREDAKLYIIQVSDENDQSKGDTDFYVDFFQAIKGYRNPELMTVSAIVGGLNGCTSADGSTSAESGSRYIEVANQTGGIFEEICTSDWALALQNLSFDAFQPRREFPLSRPADSASLVVRVNGRQLNQAGCQGCPNGWTYDPSTNTIYFGDNVVPGKGATIEVEYTAACL